jgi:hypothetical protein
VRARTHHLAALVAVLAMSIAAVASVQVTEAAAADFVSNAQTPFEPPQDRAPACIGVVLPLVEGVEGNAADVGAGVRDLLVTNLSGPSLEIVSLETRLANQAVEEARTRGCGRILMTSVRRKRGSGGGGGVVGKVLQGAGTQAAWHIPGSSVATAAARGAATAGMQTAAELASTTRARDEMRIEYRLLGASGRPVAGPRTERLKARADGEDLLTPLAHRVAESVAAVALGR